MNRGAVDRVRVSLLGLSLSLLVLPLSPRPLSTAAAEEVRGRLDLLGQVREGDATRETEAPHDLYGDLVLDGLHHGGRFDTFFRLERDFGTKNDDSEFYLGVLSLRQPLPGVDLALGRQLLTDVPTLALVADAGKVTFGNGKPFSVSVWGGAPRYFEPTFSSELQSQDETFFGGGTEFRPWEDTTLRAGYFQTEREGRVLRQLLTGSFSRSFAGIPASPRLYGSVGFDADRQNLDFLSGGVTAFLRKARLFLDAGATHYLPQDREGLPVADLDRREDGIFELFSLSELLQLRTSARYFLSPTLSLEGHYSYQRYDSAPGEVARGHVARAGIHWLPGGDGLEVAGLEYFLVDSEGGNVNGGRAYYENRVYERLVFRTRLDLAGYEKENNQEDLAVAGFVSLGFEPRERILCELYLEANHNDRFDEDVRFGFLVSYGLRLPLFRERGPV